ncbi:MAG TPA: APC family permease [Streptosporangiaceae bacterium]|nr:APC family permease [Streptosporangiaceae bacterium]
MPNHAASAQTRRWNSPSPRLEPNAISVAQDTLIGMASTGPSVSVGLTLAALAAAAAYAGGVVLVLTAIPMLVIANAYRRLNLWNANCGASFEWVGRAINPYLGFLTGWLMLAGTLIGTLSPVVVIGPSVLAVFGATTASPWPNVGIATGVGLVMLVIAVVGIRLTAQTQVALGVTEYLILVGFAVWGLARVLGHSSDSFPVTRAWFSLHGIGGKGSLAAGFLLAVFMYTGWDGTLYVNEEVRHRRVNPGRAAMLAVGLVAIIFTVSQIGLQGVTSPHEMQVHAASGLVYAGQVLGGSAGGKALAIALALSVIAATGTGIVLTARIAYGMASHRVLPPFLANVSPRFATPMAASVLAGLILIVLAWLYLLTTSVQNAFTNVINVTGLLYAAFYMLTALAAIVYYRRRIVSHAGDMLTLGILPLAAVGFLGWVVVKSLQAAPTVQIWSLAGVVGTGLVLMFAARFILRSPFFRIPRESGTGQS